ncbi:MAG: acyltransferase family protein [Mollicutes bacterium]|nr:acyltransferase family protein [Mollicutes bacterium]
MKKRNINIDLIKCIAVFSVISVHFFANAGLYKNIINSTNMYVGIIFRTLFMICVPLFIITTGYLMKNKILSKKYYLGVLRVLIIYLLDAFIYLGYNAIYNGESFSIRHIIKSILNFDIGYSWYIKMYLGLFLLIPFINLIYNNLKNKKQKQVLILTMLVLTSFQGIFNIKYILIPDWWISIYPLTYYFIGCYLKEYKVDLNKYLNILLFIIVLIVSSIINLYFSKGNYFKFGVYNDWGSIFNVLTSALVFIFIINLNLNKVPNKISKIISKISELSLGMYLNSSVIDDFLYFHYFKDIDFFSFKGYFKIVPLVLILSISLSIIINIIYKIIDKYIVKRLTKLFIK